VSVHPKFRATASARIRNAWLGRLTPGVPVYCTELQASGPCAATLPWLPRRPAKASMLAEHRSHEWRPATARQTADRSPLHRPLPGVHPGGQPPVEVARRFVASMAGLLQ